MMESLERSVILMVDDEEPNLDLLEAFLLPDGYERLVRTSDAREVSGLLEAEPPDLVLLDLHMPHRTGFDVLEEIRARTPPGDYLPVLVLTADVTSEARARALSSGARDFLTKPLDALEVRLRVRNLLEARALHRAQREAREAADSLRRRAELLAEASRALASAADAATTLERFAGVVAPGFADLCIVRYGDGVGAGALAIAATDPDRARTLRELVEAAGPPAQELGTRTDALPGWWLQHAPAVADLGAGPTFHAPLTGASRTLGELLLARVSGGTSFDPSDVTLAHELAHRVSLALENAQLIVEAQRAARARDQVLSFVAHDLRNPLASIAANAEMVRNLLPPRAPPHQRRALQRIEETALRSHALVEDLLEVSRLERGTFAVNPEPISPLPLFAEADDMLRPLAHARSIELVFEGADPVPAVLVDGKRMLQLLSNLVGNALKHTPEGGRVRVSWQPACDELTVVVEDTGPGIPVDRIPHLFGSSWRTGTVRRRRVGLGLVISRAIVDAHGGRIWVETADGAGARFCFTLPFAATANEQIQSQGNGQP